MNTLNPSMPAGGGWFTLPYATLIAFLIEGILVAVLVFGLNESNKPQPPKPQPILLTFPVIPVEVVPKPKELVKPVAKPVPKPVHNITHQRPSQPQKTVMPEPVQSPLTTAPALAEPVATPHLPAPTPEAVKPISPGIDTNAQARFEDQVRTAVQSAMVYPYAARSSHISGQTQVSFNYMDGQVSALKVVVSSGSSMLDHAALLAVSAASYPPPPKHLKGQMLPFLAWVKFNLAGLSNQ